MYITYYSKPKVPTFHHKTATLGNKKEDHFVPLLNLPTKWKILGSERKQNQVKSKIYADLSKILNKPNSQGLEFLVTQILACWLTLLLLPQAEGETGSYIKWIQINRLITTPCRKE